MANSIAVSILADVKDLQQNLGKAEGSVKDFADTTESEARSAQEHLEGVGEGADTVASKGAQAAGALSGLGDLIGGPFGAAMQGAGVAMQAAADAGDLLNVAVEGGQKVLTKAVGFAKSLGKAETYSAAAKKVSAGAQWLLNAAMEANPIGIVVVAIAALVAAFIIAYKKSDTFRKIVNAAFGALKKFVLPIIKAVKQALTTAWDAMKKATTKVWSAIKTATKAAWNLIKGFITNPIGTARKTVSTVLNTIKKVVSTVWNAIKGATKTAWNGIKTLVTKPFSDIVAFVRGIPGKIRGLYSSFKSAGSHILSGLVAGVKNAAGFVSGIAGNIWSALRGMVNSAIDHINSALQFSINTHIPGIGTVSINPPDIPHLATGGITTGPMYALIGDNPGGREAVIPLDKYDIGGSTNLYVTVNAGVGANGTEIGRDIYNYLAPYLKVSGRRLPA